jgi:hypothetical protein
MAQNYTKITKEQADSIIKSYQSERQEQKKKKKNKWFNAGAFEDGYQFGDVTRSILATSQDIENNVYKGAAGTVEGILDFGTNLISGGVSLVNKDAADKMRKFAQTNYSEQMFAQDSYGEKYTNLGETTQGIAQGVGNLAAQAGLNAVGVPWQFTALTSSAGNEMNNAFQNNASYGQALASGLFSGLVEVGTEYIGGGANKLLGMTSLGSKAIEKLGSKISNKVLSRLSKFGLDMASEGIEEVLSGIGTAIGQKLTYMNDKQLNEFRVHTEQLGNDVWKYGRLKGNMQYLEDLWRVEIRPVSFKWVYLANKTWPNHEHIDGIDFSRIQETRHRDKYIKIKVRYSGEDLAVIQAISTLFDYSYA